MLNSLRARLTLAILVTLLAIIGLIGFLTNCFIIQEFNNYIIEQNSSRLDNIVSALSEQYVMVQRRNSNAWVWNTNNIYIIGNNALNDGYIISVYDAHGNLIWDAENYDTRRCHQVRGDVSRRMEARGIGGDFVSYTYPLINNGLDVGSVSIVHYGPFFYNESEFEFLDTLNSILVLIGIGASIFALIAGYILARMITLPIAKTGSIAKQIAEGNFDARFQTSSRANAREFNELAESINNMAISLGKQENLRKQLTADVAHELRTPLTSVSSHLEAMIDGIWEATPEKLQSCHDEVMRIKNLIVDLERLAKVESENLQLDKSLINLYDIAQGISSTMEAEFSKKNLSLALMGSASFVHADKNRISQVISNLLSNAIKYTHEGDTIQIEIVDSIKSGMVKIKDNGIGIPENELPFIFERFYRAEKSRNRQTGGAGIGLAIVKSIISAHGGKVEVDSVLNKGSSFGFTIPK